MMSAQDEIGFGSVEALLVDLDGTLVDSSAPVRRAWTEFAGRHGLDPVEVQAVAQGRPSRETVELLAPAAGCTAEARELERAETSDTAGISALPGAEAVLGSERRVAIVTSCSRRLADVRLGAAGLRTPEIVISADDVARGKPDPECFRLAAERLGVPVSCCLALEDSPAGVTAARDAGIRVVALRTTHGDGELAHADAIIDDLAALGRLIG
jgi:mannitol-1-/sugar-/sorbitol-6-phosphatase